MNDLNSFVSVYKGTRQGAVTSPSLFNNNVLYAQSKCLSSCIEAATNVTLVCYADDVLNLSRSLQHIEEKFSILEGEYSQLELELNSKESEVLLFNLGPTPSVQLDVL